MTPLGDGMKNEDFLPSSILAQWSKDQIRWNVYVKVEDLWALVMDQGPLVQQIKFQDIVTQSFMGLRHGPVFIVHHVTKESRAEFAAVLHEAKGNAII